MSSREQLKIMLLKENLTIKELAPMLAEKTSRHYTAQSISSKLLRKTLRYDEFEDIAALLGYKIRVEKG
ncbi:MAG: hypothetical protein PHX18_04280 [Candidatus Gastranaerophilales bacterium]|nr:hypothetical protein [Candidatus Gastranaerophilales bacterium]